MIQFSMQTRKNLPYEGSGIRNHHSLKTDRQSDEVAEDLPGQRHAISPTRHGLTLLVHQFHLNPDGLVGLGLWRAVFAHLGLLLFGLDLLDFGRVVVVGILRLFRFRGGERLNQLYHSLAMV